MLTLVTYILFVLSITLSSLYPTTIFIKTCLRKRSAYGELIKEFVVNKTLTVVIPSKGEPIDLVVKNLSKLSSMRCIDDVLLVLDDPITYVHRLIGNLGDDFFSRGVVVVRVNGFGGRSGALTDGAKLSLAENIFLMDVDTIPSQDLLCNAKKCVDVCIGIWRPYLETYTRVEEAMAYVTGFGSWVYYELKSRLNLFVFPLGSGTVIDKQLLKSIGYWRTDVIQDDIWLGYELMFRGLKPKILNGFIDVGVPKTLSAARVQQCRWSYGSLNVFSRFLSKALKSPLKPLEKFDAIVYTLQPIASTTALISFILAIASSVTDRNIVFNILHIIPIALALMVQGTVIGFYSKKKLGLKTWRTLCLSGRTGALYIILSPLLGYYALKGLFRIKYRYTITPKIVQNKRALDISEVLSLIFSIPTTIISIITKNNLTLLISSMMFIVTTYSIIRLEKL